MAIQNEVQNAELAYLLFPFEQYSNLNGKPLVGGHIEVFEAGTSNKYITYQDWDGDSNQFKISIPEDGRIVALADPSLSYDVYVYDSFNNLVCSRLNVQCNVPGTINLSGADTRIKNTDGTLDISLQTQANNVREYTINTRNKELGVQDPLYFVRNDESATIIGFSGDGFLTEDKFEYDANDNITGYDGSAFASNGQTYSAGTNIDITDNVISVTGLPTSSDIENAISSAVTNVENKFEYNENDYITAYNSSAFAGTNYSAGDYVNIENDTISVTGLQPSGDYATHDDLTAYATKEDVESATSGKQDTLSAGDGISIINNTISVTAQGGIEQVSHNDTLSGNGNDEPLGIANIEDFVKQNDLTAYQEKGDYYSASNPSGFITNDAITGLQPSGDYVTHDEMTGYQQAGDYYSASNPSGFITNDAITGLQPSGDYVTHDEMTAYQPSGDYATHDDLTAYATTALVSSVSSELYSAISGLSGDYELVAGSGVELVDDPNAKTTTINVTAEGGNKEVENLVTANSATWNTVSDKLDTTAFSDVSGSFLTAHQDLSNYATTAQVADKLDTTAFSTVSGDFLTAHQDISDLMPKSESANFYPMTGNPSGFLTAHQDLSDYQTKADMTGYQEKGDYYSASNPSGFITGVDLTPYQTTAGMTAYQEAGDYLSATESANYYPMTGNPSGFLTEHQDLSDYQLTADMTAYATVESLTSKQDAGDYYSASNPSGFISEIPDTYLQNTDLATTDGKVTAISGIPLSAGGDVPEGVMVESAVEYNAVNEISGYNGSAIAQYGAEKQWLVHDDTLVHAANSAQYALGVNLSAVAQLLGVDETVLYSSTSGSLDDVPLSESYKNFKRLKVEFNVCHMTADSQLSYDFGGKIQEFGTDRLQRAGKISISDMIANGTASPGTMVFRRKDFNITDSAMNIIDGYQLYWNGTSWAQSTTNQSVYVFGVTGIGRKS